MLTPIRDLILVLPDAKEESHGSILLTDRTKVQPRRGTVLAAGPGAPHPETGQIVPLQVKVGDVVRYTWDHEQLIHEGQMVVLVRENRILVVERTE